MTSTPFVLLASSGVGCSLASPVPVRLSSKPAYDAPARRVWRAGSTGCGSAPDGLTRRRRSTSQRGFDFRARGHRVCVNQPSNADSEVRGDARGDVRSRMVALVAGALLAAAALGYVAVADLGTGPATAAVSTATTSPLPDDDYDADPADNSQRWWVVLIPLLVVLGVAVGTLLVMRSRKRDSEVTSRTPPDRSR